jgi:hypothetical protein
MVQTPKAKVLMRSAARGFFFCILFAPSSLVLGQVCQGGPSFKEGNMRLGAGATFGDNTKSYGAAFATGSPQGPFASVGLSTVQYDNVSGNGAVVTVSGGWSVDVVPSGAAQLCPLIGFSYQNGPNYSTGFGDFPTSAHAFALGASFGGVAMTSPGFDFVPFASFGYYLATGNASGGGFNVSTNQNYGDLTIGSGFVINRTLTLQPGVSIPVGLENGKTSFSIAVAFNFGSHNAHPSSGTAVGNR